MSRIFMTYCSKCSRENYLMAVASGQCAWCGYVAVKEDINNGTIWEVEDEQNKRSDG